MFLPRYMTIANDFDIIIIFLDCLLFSSLPSHIVDFKCVDGEAMIRKLDNCILPQTSNGTGKQ